MSHSSAPPSSTDKLVGNTAEEPLCYCSLNVLMEDNSLLGLGVHIMATPHNKKGQFEVCLFLLWKIKWHLCTHAHVYACSVCKCMQKHPRCLVWQNSKMRLYFCMAFSSTMVPFSVHIQQLYFGLFQLE